MYKSETTMTDPTRIIPVHYDCFKLPFGPVHPALKEPISINVTVKKEEILDVDIRLGHVNRGIEKLAQSRNLVQAIHLIERVCGICSHSHTTCFVQGLEKLSSIDISVKAAYLRTVLFELERMHSHLLLLGVVAQEIGFTTVFMHAFHMREHILDLFERLTGNRIHHAMNVIGGVRWDLNPGLVSSIHVSLNVVESSIKVLRDAFKDKTAEKRLCGVGRLDPSDALGLGVVGPVARGSGLVIDARKDNPYAAYKDLAGAFSVITMQGKDAYSRIEVRIQELFESINIIRAALDEMPAGSLEKCENPMRLSRKVPAGEVVSAVEAPRGELFYYIKTDGKDGLSRLHIRTPTFANIVALKDILVGGEIADIPAALASLDPCISCTTRMIVLGEN